MLRVVTWHAKCTAFTWFCTPAHTPFQHANVGTCMMAPLHRLRSTEKLRAMDLNSRIRWDRIGLVALILVGCSSGMVALVGGTEAEEEEFALMIHSICSKLNENVAAYVDSGRILSIYIAMVE